MTLWKMIWIKDGSAVGVFIAREDDEVATNYEADAFAIGLVWLDASDVRR
jgi:hypothetical protein